MAAEKGNTYAKGYGRPRIYDDTEENAIKVSELVDDYFVWIQGEEGEREEEFPVYETLDSGAKIQTGTKKEMVKYWIRRPEPPTVTGLTLHLGFADKSTLYDYSKREYFSHSIKKGLSQIEKFHEIKTSYGDKCTGNIFVLKNFGWRDSSHVDHTTDGKAMNQDIKVEIVRSDE